MPPISAINSFSAARPRNLVVPPMIGWPFPASAPAAGTTSGVSMWISPAGRPSFSAARWALSAGLLRSSS